MHSTETKTIIGTPGLVYGNPIAGKLGKPRTSKGSHLPSLLSEVTLFAELKNSTELVPQFLRPLKRVVSPCGAFYDPLDNLLSGEWLLANCRSLRSVACAQGGRYGCEPEPPTVMTPGGPVDGSPTLGKLGETD